MTKFDKSTLAVVVLVLSGLSAQRPPRDRPVSYGCKYNENKACTCIFNIAPALLYNIHRRFTIVIFGRKDYNYRRPRGFFYSPTIQRRTIRMINMRKRRMERCDKSCGPSRIRTRAAVESEWSNYQYH